MGWGLLIYAAVTVGIYLANRYLFPGPEEEKAKADKFGQEQLPKAEEGTPIPIVYGTERVTAGCVVWHSDLGASPLRDHDGFVYRGFIHLVLCAGAGYLAHPVKDDSVSPDSTNNWYTWTAFGHPSKIEHELQTGMGPFRLKTTNILPNGLSLTQDYYVIRVSSTQVRWATSKANSFLGTFVSFTDNGIGTQTVHQEGFKDDRIKLRKFFIGERIVYSSVGNPPIDFYNGFISRDFNDANFWGGLGSGGGIRGKLEFHQGTLDEGDYQPQVRAIYDRDGLTKTNYRGFASLMIRGGTQGVPGFQFGESPSVPPFSVVVEHTPIGAGQGTVDGQLGPDANPAEVLYDLLTEKWYGLGLDVATQVDRESFRAAAVTLDSEKHGFTGILVNQTKASGFIAEVLKQIDAAIYEDMSDGLIKLTLVRKVAQPSLLPIYSVANIDEFESYKITTWNETYNQVRITFRDRNRNWSPRTYIAQDLGNFAMQGYRIRSLDLNFPGISNEELAGAIATRELKTVSTPQRTVSFFCNRDALDLVPGSAFRLTWAPYNLSNRVMRVEKIDYGQYEDNRCRVSAIQDQFDTEGKFVWALPPPPPREWSGFADGLFGGTFGLPGVGDGSDGDADAWEMPPWFATQVEKQNQAYDASSPQIFYLATTPNYATSIYPDSYYVPIATREPTPVPDDYLEDQIRVDFIPTAQVSTAYPQSTDVYDETVGLVLKNIQDVSKLVTIEGSTQAIIDGQIQQQGKNLIYVGGEFMAFESADDNGDGTWILNNVWRGVLDSSIKDHAVDERVWFLFNEDLNRVRTDAVGTESYSEDSFYVEPDTVSFRFITSKGALDLDQENAVEGQLTIASRGLAPAPVDDFAVDPIQFGSSPTRAEINMMNQSMYRLSFKQRNRDSDLITKPTASTEAYADGQDHNPQFRLDCDLLADVLFDAIGASPAGTPTAGGGSEWKATTTGMVCAIQSGSWGFGDILMSVDYTVSIKGVNTFLGSLFNTQVSVYLNPHRNLIADYEFEESATSALIEWDDSAGASGVEISSGTGALRRTGNYAGNTAGGDPILRQDLPLRSRDTIPTPDQRYGLDIAGQPIQFRVFVHDNTGSTDTITVSIREYTDTFSLISTLFSTTYDPPTDWSQRDAVASGIIDKDAGFIRFELDFNNVDGGVMTCEVDHVWLQVGNRSAQQLANEFLDALTSWTQTAGTWRTGTTNRCEGSGYVQGPVSLAGTAQLDQTITGIPSGFKEGDWVQLNGFRSGDGGTFDSSQLSVELRDASNNILASVASGFADPASGTWENIDLWIQVPANFHNLIVKWETKPGADATHNSKADMTQLWWWTHRKRHFLSMEDAVGWFGLSANPITGLWRFLDDTDIEDWAAESGNDMTKSGSSATAYDPELSTAGILNTTGHLTVSSATPYDINEEIPPGAGPEYAFEGDGSTDRLEIPGASLIGWNEVGNTYEMSYSCWLNIPDATPATATTLLAKWDGTSAGNSFWIEIQTSGDIWITLWDSAVGLSRKVIIPAAAVGEGFWIHLAIVVDLNLIDVPITAADQIQVWLDETVVNITSTDPPLLALQEGTALLRFFGTASGAYLAAEAGGLRMWSKALTEAEIFAENLVSKAIITDNLIGDWALENSYTDASGNGNTWTVFGTPIFNQYINDFAIYYEGVANAVGSLTRLVYKRTGTAAGYYLQMDAAGDLEFGVEDAGSNQDEAHVNSRYSNGEAIRALCVCNRSDGFMKIYTIGRNNSAEEQSAAPGSLTTAAVLTVGDTTTTPNATRHGSLLFMQGPIVRELDAVTLASYNKCCQGGTVYPSTLAEFDALATKSPLSFPSPTTLYPRLNSSGATVEDVGDGAVSLTVISSPPYAFNKYVGSMVGQMVDGSIDAYTSSSSTYDLDFESAAFLMLLELKIAAGTRDIFSHISSNNGYGLTVDSSGDLDLNLGDGSISTLNWAVDHRLPGKHQFILVTINRTTGLAQIHSREGSSSTLDISTLGSLTVSATFRIGDGPNTCAGMDPSLFGFWKGPDAEDITTSIFDNLEENMNYRGVYLQ